MCAILERHNTYKAEKPLKKHSRVLRHARDLALPGGHSADSYIKCLMLSFHIAGIAQLTSSTYVRRYLRILIRTIFSFYLHAFQAIYAAMYQTF